MRNLIIEKGGKLLDQGYGNDKKKYVKSINGSHLFESTCEIAENVTLKDIFILIKKILPYKEWGKVFGCHYMELVESGLKKIKLEEPDNDILYLELSWPSLDIKNKDESYDQYLSFYGKGKTESFAIEFSEPYYLSQFNVKINNMQKIYKYDHKKMKTICEFKRIPTLFDVVWSILYELTFFGSQENRVKELKKLQKAVEEIDKGDCKLLTLDEVLEDFKKVGKK